jgi:hypothetical protein
MLPTGHIEFTWAALNLLQRRRGIFLEADYRLVALAALAPDLVDKPLALTIYSDADAALFWGHNLWLHVAVWATVLIVPVALGPSRRSGVPRTGEALFAPSRDSWRGTARRALPYLLAFSGHLLADRMWGFRESLFYPLGAGYWHPWVHVGEPAAMLDAYVTIILTTPILVAFEIIGAFLLVWLISDRRLFEIGRLKTFLRTGRFVLDSEPGTAGRPRGLAQWLAGWTLR